MNIELQIQIKDEVFNKSFKTIREAQDYLEEMEAAMRVEPSNVGKILNW